MNNPVVPPEAGASPSPDGPKSGLLAALGSIGGDLKSPFWIYVKGFLFLATGLLAGGLLLLEHPTWKDVVLLGMTVWCFCRFYYFAFYVIEHYVDGEFKFAGLGSFLRYLMTRRQQRDPE
jgi:hypothetical protein